MAKRRAKAAQVHPTGPLETVDDAWKDRVRAEMKQRGWGQKDLAAKIDISEGAISNMFMPGDRQIRFKAQIHRVLGWPNSLRMDGALRRIQDNWPLLTDEQREAVLRLVDSITPTIKP